MLPVLLASLAAAVPTVGCDSHIESKEPTAAQRRATVRQSVVVDGTIFWSLRRARELTFDPEHPSYKAAISVRAGARLTLKVAARDRDWVSLDYDRTVNDPPGVPVTHFVPCAPDTPRFSDDGVIGRETSWAGGFNVGRAGCATLLLRRAGQAEWRRVRVGFGQACRSA
jgi:hypothetical protein